MSRGLWFVAGAASGVYALVKVRRTAEAFTPDGVGARVAALRAGAHVFTQSVAEGMAQREAVLCAQLEAGPVSHRLIAAGPAPSTESSADGDR